MKKWRSWLFLVAVIGILGYVFFYNILDEKDSGQSTVELVEVALPVEVEEITGIVFDNYWHKLFMVVQESNGYYGVWSLDNQQTFARKLEVASDRFYAGHLFVDSQHNLYFSVNYPARLYRSADGGETWQVVLEEVDAFWGMADKGEGTLFGTLWSYNLPAIYISHDQGQSWGQWQNFHEVFPQEAVIYNEADARFKLRHLHDIVTYNDMIFVGTGDITRWTLLSDDEGETWQQIWDEGFTAHLLDKEKDLLILGADLPHSRGIAVYDLKTPGQGAKDVWQPEELGWQGYIYSLIEEQGKYLAAVHNEQKLGKRQKPYGVLISEAGYNWDKLIEFQDDEEFSSLYLAGTGAGGVYLSHNGKLFTFSLD